MCSACWTGERWFNSRVVPPSGMSGTNAFRWRRQSTEKNDPCRPSAGQKFICDSTDAGTAHELRYPHRHQPFHGGCLSAFKPRVDCKFVKFFSRYDSRLLRYDGNALPSEPTTFSRFPEMDKKLSIRWFGSPFNRPGDWCIRRFRPSNHPESPDSLDSLLYRSVYHWLRILSTAGTFSPFFYWTKWIPFHELIEKCFPFLGYFEYSQEVRGTWRQWLAQQTEFTDIVIRCCGRGHFGTVPNVDSSPRLRNISTRLLV